MKQLKRFVAITLSLGLGACSQPSPPAAQSGTDDAGQSAVVQPAPVHVMDIGDVEADLRLVGSIPLDARDDSMQIEELMTKMNELTSVIVTLDHPAPASLPIQFVLQHTLDYTQNPIQISLRILRDNMVIENTGTILSSKPRVDRFEVIVDVLQGLEQIPESMLVHAEMDLQMIDVNQSAISDMSTELSNPVRINFAPAPAAPAGEAPAVPADPAAEASGATTGSGEAPASDASTAQ